MRYSGRVTLYVTLASCAFLAGWLVYRYDMYEREPWYMVLFAVGLGFGAMFLVGRVEIEDRVVDALGRVPLTVAAAASAAVVEELTRLILVLGLALFIRGQFNDPMDGIVYGCLIGLGMAIEESISYLGEAAVAETLPRGEIIRIMGHVVMGGITGFGIGMFRMRMKRWLVAVAGCVSVAITLHFLWDLIAFETGARGESPPLVTAASVVLIVGGMVFFGFLVVLASEWSRQVFAPDQAHRLWGWPFTLFMRRRGDAGGRSGDGAG